MISTACSLKSINGVGLVNKSRVTELQAAGLTKMWLRLMRVSREKEAAFFKAGRKETPPCKMVEALLQKGSPCRVPISIGPPQVKFLDTVRTFTVVI